MLAAQLAESILKVLVPFAFTVAGFWWLHHASLSRPCRDLYHTNEPVVWRRRLPPLRYL